MPENKGKLRANTRNFQFVYVKDGAEAILRCLGNKEAVGQCYNLCGDELVDYELFFRILKECAEEAEVRELSFSLAEAGKQGIPIPFPARSEETELVSNEKSKRELGMEYTSLAEGMQKTYNAFKHVYED